MTVEHLTRPELVDLLSHEAPVIRDYARWTLDTRQHGNTLAARINERSLLRHLALFATCQELES